MNNTINNFSPFQTIAGFNQIYELTNYITNKKITKITYGVQKRMKLPLNKIYKGDANKYMKSLPDECVDLVVSSPPYNLWKEYEKKVSLDTYLEEQKQ